MPVGQALAAPWISTPAFLADRARRIHTGLLALNDVITALATASRLSPDSLKYKQWKALLANWGRWYGQTSDSTWLWSATDATLESYERDLQSWTAWVLRTYPDAAASVPTPPPVVGPDGKPRDGIPLWAWGVGAGVLTFGLAKLFGKL
jgi:hypothetical protein